MPWVQEQKDDEKKAGQKPVKKDGKSQSKMKDYFQQKNRKPKTSEKCSSEPLETKQAKEESKSTVKPEDLMDPDVKLKLLSKVVKMENIELFEWKYKPNVLT